MSADGEEAHAAAAKQLAMDEYERMLASPGSGLERVGLKKSTSIIEKLTNFTYPSMEREEDAALV